MTDMENLLVVLLQFLLASPIDSVMRIIAGVVHFLLLWNFMSLLRCQVLLLVVILILILNLTSINVVLRIELVFIQSVYVFESLKLIEAFWFLA